MTIDIGLLVFGVSVSEGWTGRLRCFFGNKTCERAGGVEAFFGNEMCERAGIVGAVWRGLSRKVGKSPMAYAIGAARLSWCGGRFVECLHHSLAIIPKEELIQTRRDQETSSNAHYVMSFALCHRKGG